MDLNLLEDDKVPMAISEDILKYLQDQNDEGEEGTYESKLTNFTETQIKEILEELLKKFERKQKMKEDYEARVAAHNQRELFDMNTIVEDFRIDEKMYKLLTFRETLIIAHLVDLEAVPVGGLCLDVQKARGRPPSSRRQCEEIEVRLQRIFNKEHKNVVGADELENVLNENLLLRLEDCLRIQQERSVTKFLVHVNSQFDMNGVNAGSAITSWVDRELHTIEELRREFYVDEKQTVEKDLYVGLVENYYYVKHVSPTENIDDRKFYSLRKTKKYISEGSNFLLQRYLAITRYVGIFELSAMYINGDMCRNIYECTGPEGSMVNGNKVDVCRIERTVIEECGLEHKSCTILTLQGQIIRQEWEDTPYILQVNPLVNITNEKPTGNEQILLKHTWEGDMQLFSYYLDEKIKAEMKIKSYMIDHPEFKNIIVDYINAILLLKPEDILDFTMSHFMSFSPKYMPRNEYFN